MTVLDRADSSQGDRCGWEDATEASLCISHLRTGVSLVPFIVCPLWIAQSLLQRGELSSRLIEKARINSHFLEMPGVTPGTGIAQGTVLPFSEARLVPLPEKMTVTGGCSGHLGHLPKPLLCRCLSGV